jgi:hypothetical protein
MRHARPDALDQLDALIVALRALDGMKEKSRGVFYRGAKAFLHFHEDPAGLFCDVRLGDSDFDRFRVSTQQEQSALLKRVRAALKR